LLLRAGTPPALLISENASHLSTRTNEVVGKISAPDNRSGL